MSSFRSLTRNPMTIAQGHTGDWPENRELEVMRKIGSQTHCCSSLHALTHLHSTAGIMKHPIIYPGGNRFLRDGGAACLTVVEHECVFPHSNANVCGKRLSKSNQIIYCREVHGRFLGEPVVYVLSFWHVLFLSYYIITVPRQMQEGWHTVPLHCKMRYRFH